MSGPSAERVLIERELNRAVLVAAFRPGRALGEGQWREIPP